MSPTCCRVAAVLPTALLALSACGTGTVAADDWARDQLPDDIATLNDATAGMRSASADCDAFDEVVERVRAHPHPDDQLMANQWDHFIRVVEDLQEACRTRDPVRIGPVLDRFAGLLVGLARRVPVETVR